MLSLGIMQLDSPLSPCSDSSNWLSLAWPIRLYVFIACELTFSQTRPCQHLACLSRVPPGGSAHSPEDDFNFWAYLYHVDTIWAFIFTLLSFRIKTLSRHRLHLPESSTFPSYLFLLGIWTWPDNSPTPPSSTDPYRVRCWQAEKELNGILDF